MIFATVLLSALSSISVSALPMPGPSGSSVFRVLANTNANAAMPQGVPSPFSSPPTSIKPVSTHSQQIPFDSCPVPEGGSPPAGIVHDVTITPCSRSSPSEPCHFHYGQNYTIDISYTSYLPAQQPRSGLAARDDRTDPSESYAYSGQTFSGCSYTDCPVQADKKSNYRYEFDTLLSVSFCRILTWSSKPHSLLRNETAFQLSHLQYDANRRRPFPLLCRFRRSVRQGQGLHEARIRRRRKNRETIPYPQSQEV